MIDTQILFFVPEAVAPRPRALEPRGLARRGGCEAADALLYEEIERRRREPDLEERTDVLSLLLRARDEDGGR